MKSLDRIDLRILALLQDNGRISNKDLAEQVNLSTSACPQPPQRLLDEDWRLGIQGIVNIDKLAAPVQCLATLAFFFKSSACSFICNMISSSCGLNKFGLLDIFDLALLKVI